MAESGAGGADLAWLRAARGRSSDWGVVWFMVQAVGVGGRGRAEA